MSQSSELAAGEGFTFEGAVAAYYLAALIGEKFAPGIEDSRVVKVSLQQRDFGEPLDDIIVDFENESQQSARLSLQAKQSITISNADSNSDFREVIRDSLRTLNGSGFCKDDTC